MYLNILKRDLRRKKTMNCIILLFVMLSTMFFSSSVNNILSVIGGLDRYLDMAGMTGQVALIMEQNGEEPFADVLRENDKVRSFRRETILQITPDQVFCEGTEFTTEVQQLFLSSVDTMAVNCYDLSNERITEVEPGTVLMTGFLAKRLNADAGDTVQIKVSGETVSLKMAGICKDAVVGAEIVNCPRLILSSSDFERYYASDRIRENCRAGLYLIDTDNQTAAALFSVTAGCVYHVDRSTIKMSYLPDTLTAGIVMVVSLFLILISFVVLRFTIGFTIAEEFREIGVMKALGLRSSSVRLLYLVKYFGIAVIGALIGLAASFPFGSLLMESAGKSMVLGNDRPVLSGIICTAVNIGVVALFSWRCTAQIKKLTPIDAVRSGQTGERFRRHSSLSLGKSRIGTAGFLSLNNIVSAPKQSAILITVFTLCTLLVMVLSNMAATFVGKEIISVCSLTESDLFLKLKSYQEEIPKGNMTVSEVNRAVEAILAENGMPAKVYTEAAYNTAVSFGDHFESVRFLQCTDTQMTDYIYSAGTPPQYENEIVLTYTAAEKIGADIGDTVHIKMNGMEKDFIIAALTDSMSNLGMTGRFYPSLDLPVSAFQWTDSLQVVFDDHPDDGVIQARKAELKQLFDTEEVYTAEEYVEVVVGAGDTITGVKNLTLIVSLLIIILMTVLLERSFISKERTEIALMKAVGFRNRSVVGIHVLRFVMIAAVSVLLAAAVSAPATRLIMRPVYQALGSVRTFIVSIDSRENFIVLPLAVLTAVVCSAAVTALYTGSVKASDTAAIE